MLWLKSCPRCGGDLFDREDMYGTYVSCAQCGHILPSLEEIVLRFRGHLKEVTPALAPVATE